MDRYLSGHQAVVTGASRGIGRATAIELAARGANLVLHYNSSHSEIQQVADEVTQFGVEATTIQQDLQEHAQLDPFVETVWSEFGKVQCWVNNAGADVLTGDCASMNFEEKLALLLNVDLYGTMLLSRAVGAKMVRANNGVIINMGWDQADTGMEGDSGELFSAVKGGIMAFSKSLAVSLAPSVRVHCVAPGWIRTAWGQKASKEWQERAISEALLKRWGEPKDVATAVSYLCSPDAAFLTGQILRINGGAVR